MLPYVPLESPDEGLKGTDCWFLMKQRDVFRMFSDSSMMVFSLIKQRLLIS